MESSLTRERSSPVDATPGRAGGWRSAFSRSGQPAVQAPPAGFVSLARTIAVRGAVSVVVATGVILGVFYGLASSQQEQDAAQYAGAKAEAIARSLDVFSQTIRINTENAYGIFRNRFGATLELADEANSLLVDDGNIVNGNTAQVDDFANGYPGGNATVFVVQGEDFRRVTTSVKREDGSRAIGTLLDRKSPAYAAMRAGKTYVGAAVLFGRPFMTVYEPVRDSAGRMVAALYIGLDISAQQASLAQAVARTRIFDTGGLYVVNPGADAAAASLVFHPSAAGRPLSEVLREQPEQWLRRISGPGSSWIDDAAAVLQPDATQRRYAAVVRSEATGWLVVAEMPAAEAMASLYRELTWIGGFIALAAVLLGAGLVIFVRRMLSPLGKLSDSVQAIGRGDLSMPLATDRRDEIGVITRDLESMRVGLAEVVGAVRIGTDTDRHGLEPDRRRQHRPVVAHRAAGQLAGGDRGVDGRADRHRQAERRQRAPGQPARGVGLARWRSRAARWSAQVVDTMGSINDIVAEDRRHHRRDRRHRLPDQHPGAERRGGSGARRRAGPRLRGGRRRSAQPGAAQRRSGQGDQGA